MTPRQQADAMAKEPGFWPNYQEPTPMAEAIQRPLSDPNWASRVINAYLTKPKKQDL